MAHFLLFIAVIGNTRQMEIQFGLGEKVFMGKKYEIKGNKVIKKSFVLQSVLNIMLSFQVKIPMSYLLLSVHSVCVVFCLPLYVS